MEQRSESWVSLPHIGSWGEVGSLVIIAFGYIYKGSQFHISSTGLIAVPDSVEALNLLTASLDVPRNTVYGLEQELAHV